MTFQYLYASHVHCCYRHDDFSLNCPRTTAAGPPSASEYLLFMLFVSQYVVKFISDVSIFRIIRDAWKCRDHGVLGTNIDGVVHFPVDVAHFSRRMKQALQ